jgi:hypothetical protein
VATACAGGGGGDASPPTSAPDATGPGLPTTAPPATIAGIEPVGELPPAPELLEVVYRVERLTTGVVDTEQRLLRAPFEVRIETHRVEPDDVDLDAEPEILDVAVLGGAETGPPDQDRLLVVVPPTPVLRSGHLRTDVDAAEAAGVLEPLGFGRRIAGRQCTELRTGAPLDGGILHPPTDDDRNDVCVDGDGIVLREEITQGGIPIERRTAVQVDLAPDLDDGTFEPLGERIPEIDGGGRVRRVTAESRPADVAHHQLAEAPPGLSALGRFGVLTDAPVDANAAGTLDQVLSMVDVWTGGGDLLVIENGASVRGGPVLGRGHVDAALSWAPEATAVFLTTGIEVRAPLPTGRFVRITSTLPLDVVLALAESLEVVDGPGEVVPFDDQPDVTGRFRASWDDGEGEGPGPGG